MSYGTGTRSGLTFTSKELFDLGLAWVTLSVAFALLLNRSAAGIRIEGLLETTALCFVTAGVAFLLHELAHKVVAIHFGQVAEFRADYQMLFLAIMSALIGFLFAAPGAVYHRGRITVRENGLISLAGPLTNHGLALLFLPLLLFGPGVLGRVGQLGVWINLFLAAFNMIPFGPLDGKSVWNWNKAVFVAVFVPSILVAGYVVLFVGLR
ncbi:metalloprotease [Halomontanus rarus]|uniref:metalloprotease n=1 Tax=Halomontanus rarus TaxID=3034020 RepID=UPI001A97F13D